MACMAHVCKECGWEEEDNEPGPKKCPKCGGKVNHFFDEE